MISSNFNTNNTIYNEVKKTSKKEFPLDKAYNKSPVKEASIEEYPTKKLSFLDKNRNVVEIALEMDNFERIKSKFQDDIVGSNGQYYVQGNAIDEFSQMWSYLTEKVELLKADRDGDGRLSADEYYKELKYDTINGENVTFTDIFGESDTEIGKKIFKELLGDSISIDNEINAFLRRDTNLDFKFSSSEKMKSGFFDLNSKEEISNSGDLTNFRERFALLFETMFLSLIDENEEKESINQLKKSSNPIEYDQMSKAAYDKDKSLATILNNIEV